jgi:hypothetical protein
MPASELRIIRVDASRRPVSARLRRLSNVTTCMTSPTGPSHMRSTFFLLSIHRTSIGAAQYTLSLKNAMLYLVFER